MICSIDYPLENGPGLESPPEKWPCVRLSPRDELMVYQMQHFFSVYRFKKFQFAESLEPIQKSCVVTDSSKGPP